MAEQSGTSALAFLARVFGSVGWSHFISRGRQLSVRTSPDHIIRLRHSSGIETLSFEWQLMKAYYLAIVTSCPTWVPENSLNLAYLEASYYSWA